MGLFRKKEVRERVEELPELPELPKLPELPELPKFEKSIIKGGASLPSFSSQIEDELNQETKLPSITQFETEFPKKEKRTIEISSIKTKIPFAQFPQAFLPHEKLSIPKQESTKITEPVYVRIDKFRAAISDFQEIHNKILEIEELFKDIKEVKQKEDEELREWEKEIEMLKLRIDAINNNIFSKIK